MSLLKKTESFFLGSHPFNKKNFINHKRLCEYQRRLPLAVPLFVISIYDVRLFFFHPELRSMQYACVNGRSYLAFAKDPNPKDTYIRMEPNEVKLICSIAMYKVRPVHYVPSAMCFTRNHLHELLTHNVTANIREYV